MKKLLLSFLLFVSFLCKAQQSIIVGPQGDCDTKGIRKNEHASSKWFDVSGVAKLKITTLQHRTFDKSRIYNESGNLIWEWGGESFNDTWYEKVHIVAIKENKIRVEFYQGYSDPFCNGSIKVEKEDREIIPQMQIVKNKGNGVYLEEKKAVVIQNSQSNNSSFKPTYKANPNSSSIIGNPIKIGNLLVAEFDFTEKMNWEDAYNSCFSLGKGWRLPTKMELNMLYNNLGKIGDVGNDGYWTSTENGSERVWTQYLFNDGYSYDVVKYGSLFVRAVGNYGVVKVTPTKTRNEKLIAATLYGTEGNNTTNNITESSDCSDIVKAYELAVRKNITALRKINNNAFVSQNELISLDNDIRKWQNIVMKKCAYDPKYANRVINIMEQLQLGYNSTFPSIKENSNSSSSSSSNTSNSNSVKKGHEFNVIVKWQKTCGNCPFPSPSIQNGVLLSQPSPRGGYYNLQPICPVCGKKPYGELSGNTNNMIEGNKTFRVVCKGN